MNTVFGAWNYLWLSSGLQKTLDQEEEASRPSHLLLADMAAWLVVLLCLWFSDGVRMRKPSLVPGSHPLDLRTECSDASSCRPSLYPRGPNLNFSFSLSVSDTVLHTRLVSALKYLIN